MKCIKCNKPALAEHLCEQCFLERYTNVTGFKEFVLLYCATCNRYAYTREWNSRLPLSDAIIKAIKASMKTKHAPHRMNIEPEIPEVSLDVGTRLKINVNVEISTKIHTMVKEETFCIPLKITFMNCPRCDRKEQEYFEGIIQLRNKQSAQFEAARQFIYDEVHTQ